MRPPSARERIAIRLPARRLSAAPRSVTYLPWSSTSISASRRLEQDSACCWIAWPGARQLTESTDTRASPATRLNTGLPAMPSETLRPCWVRPPSVLTWDDGFSERFSSDSGSVIGGGFFSDLWVAVLAGGDFLRYLLGNTCGRTTLGRGSVRRRVVWGMDGVSSLGP